jgi:hypothetical protein
MILSTVSGDILYLVARREVRPPCCAATGVAKTERNEANRRAAGRRQRQEREEGIYLTVTSKLDCSLESVIHSDPAA